MDPREGDERLSAAKSGDLDRSNSGVPKEGKIESKSKGRRKASGDLSRALKSVYDSTLAEDVPDDFMDLLGKLG